MSGATSIEWAHATWNPVRGCSRVSSGCTRCYAERVAARFRGDDDPFHGFAYSDKAGPHWTGRVELVPDTLDWPLRTKRPKWVREAEERGERPRVFVNSMSDLFHEKLSDEAIAAVFGVMAAKPEWDFLVLTKRPERMRRWFEWAAREMKSEAAMLLEDATNALALTVNGLAKFYDRSRGASWPLPNVWLGTSVENQETADERIPLLFQTPAAVRFVSYEPALGPVEFRRAFGSEGPRQTYIEQIDGLIFGGESGPGARQCDIAWARSARNQCKAAGVAFFCKQLGARPINPDRWPQLARLQGADQCRLFLRDRKGGDMSEWPEDLRVRELPR